jgi:molybdopterin/thiamine biosynthesis adenylyltransferase
MEKKDLDARVSIEFVLNVLRQHENDLDRLIAELDVIVDKVANITEKMQQIATELRDSR